MMLMRKLKGDIGDTLCRAVSPFASEFIKNTTAKNKDNNG
jgi:hypothetical protein